MNQISNAGQSWLHLFTRSLVIVSTAYSGRNATFFNETFTLELSRNIQLKPILALALDIICMALCLLIRTRRTKTSTCFICFKLTPLFVYTSN